MSNDNYGYAIPLYIYLIIYNLNILRASLTSFTLLIAIYLRSGPNSKSALS